MLRFDPAGADAFSLALSAQVTALMSAQGMTYRDLAEQTAIPASRMWNRLHGGGFTAPEQWKVAAALGTSVVDLTQAAVTAMGVAA